MQQIDSTWLNWLHKNIARGCDTEELYQKMRAKGLSENTIRDAISKATKPASTPSKMPPIDASWLSWLQENIERNCDINHIYTRLMEKGFNEASIRQAIEDAGGKAPEKIVHFQDYEALSKIAITKNPRAKRYPSNKLQLYTIEEFMTPQECDDIVALIEPNLQRSTITTSKDVSSFRTSSTCWLRRVDDQKVITLHAKVCKMLGINASFSEGIQGQQYLVGQEFKPHTDAFDPETFEKFAAVPGQRTWTFMIYLDDTVTGGGTRMHNIDQTFQPTKGMAVVWNNLNPDGTVNSNTLHQGMPVEYGKKTIITQWFRDKGTGDIFG